MVINIYGDETLPKIILLHPMLADGKSMLKLTKGMEGRYCFIAPDLSGQGSDKGEFVSAKQEAETLTAFLKEKGYGTIELLAGASLGGLTGMYMLAEPGIRYKTIVFDGTPMYENARLLYHVMRSGFLKKHRKAKRMPVEGMEKKMEEKYGVFGSAMAHSFVRMSEKSITAIVRDCTDFPFPPIEEGIQRRIFLEVGSRDVNCRQNRTVLRHYPYLHIRVREGYGHCMYPAVHHEEYGRLLERYMKNKGKG